MTFSEQLMDAADDAGMIPWDVARQAVIEHQLLGLFLDQHHHLYRQDIDAAKLLNWLGY